MSTLLLKKIGAPVQHLFSRIFFWSRGFLIPPEGQPYSPKIVFTLTNRRAIDQNSRIIWKGDEREEL
jgi:hypothetical protein